ncbi:uncharacterized protein LOC128718779 [Anopheles marshallii]|uniref:uncharacterized protein LOC128718779 n=1 Tax=Anopheles marshallii TaxID=1521116 RepID=UPI00237B9EFB|nr:uncharacterized protein LOC128718779 [Anopheles marshallii]
MSKVPAGRLRQPASNVISEQPHALVDSLSTIAPSLGSLSALKLGGSSAPAPAGIDIPFAGRGLDTLTSNQYGQLGVSAVTEGVFTNDGHFNKALSEAVTESAGHLVSDMIGEETVTKMEQRYAKAVDKITDVEMSAGQIAMAGRSLAYLDGDEATDIPDAGEMPDAFSTELLEPEADAVATDLYELDAEQLGQIAVTAGYIPQMEVPDGAADAAEADGCCGCCGDDAGGDDDLCGCGEMCVMCGCGGCCDCGDCFGCGDCIGCGDCPSCCSFDCSIM